MKPHYEQYCAMHCTDTLGRPRVGTEWLHAWGITRWVCHPCAEKTAAAAGIPTDAQVRKIRERTMARLQVHMETATLMADLEAEGLDEPTPAGTGATPVRPGA